MDDLITLTDAATLVGKNLRTIQRYIQNGQLTRHKKDGKNFVSHKELESKFNVKTTKSPESVVTQKTEDATKTRQEPSVNDYQKKWVEEIQKHAETREELGIWKGRAEAYQAFASRLLGTGPNGVNEKIGLEQNPPESMRNKKDEPIINVNRSPQMPYSLIYYIAFAVLFVILILLFVLIRIYTS